MSSVTATVTVTMTTPQSPPLFKQHFVGVANSYDSKTNNKVTNKVVANKNNYNYNKNKNNNNYINNSNSYRANSMYTMMKAVNNKIQLQKSAVILKSQNPKGLQNYGNTCFLNSILQSLAHSEILYEQVIKSSHRFRCNCNSTCNNSYSNSNSNSNNNCNSNSNSNSNSNNNSNSNSNSNHSYNNCNNVSSSNSGNSCVLCAVERAVLSIRSSNKSPNGMVMPIIKLLPKISYNNNLMFGRQEDAHEFFTNLINSVQDLSKDWNRTDVVSLNSNCNKHSQVRTDVVSVVSVVSDNSGDSVVANANSSMGSEPISNPWSENSTSTVEDQEKDNAKKLYDNVNEEDKKPISKERCYLNKLFQGVLVSRVCCAVCNSVSDKVESFIDLQLDINKAASVETALDAYCSVENLDGSNAYFCSTCNRNCDAKKFVKLRDTPPILAVQLKRFAYNGRAFSKIRHTVEYPLELNVQPYVLEEVKVSSEDSNSGRSYGNSSIGTKVNIVSCSSESTDSNCTGTKEKSPLIFRNTVKILNSKAADVKLAIKDITKVSKDVSDALASSQNNLYHVIGTDRVSAVCLDQRRLRKRLHDGEQKDQSPSKKTLGKSLDDTATIDSNPLDGSFTGLSFVAPVVANSSSDSNSSSSSTDLFILPSNQSSTLFQSDKKSHLPNEESIIKAVSSSSDSINSIRSADSSSTVYSSAQYELVSVVVHKGRSIHSGHYVAYTKNNGRWFCLDDEVVTNSTSSEVIKQRDAYLLFYEKKKLSEQEKQILRMRSHAIQYSGFSVSTETSNNSLSNTSSDSNDSLSSRKRQRESAVTVRYANKRLAISTKLNDYSLTRSLVNVSNSNSSDDAEANTVHAVSNYEESLKYGLPYYGSIPKDQKIKEENNSRASGDDLESPERYQRRKSFSAEDSPVRLRFKTPKVADSTDCVDRKGSSYGYIENTNSYSFPNSPEKSAFDSIYGENHDSPYINKLSKEFRDNNSKSYDSVYDFSGEPLTIVGNQSFMQSASVAVGVDTSSKQVSEIATSIDGSGGHAELQTSPLSAIIQSKNEEILKLRSANTASNDEAISATDSNLTSHDSTLEDAPWIVISDSSDCTSNSTSNLLSSSSSDNWSFKRISNSKTKKVVHNDHAARRLGSFFAPISRLGSISELEEGSDASPKKKSRSIQSSFKFAKIPDKKKADTKLKVRSFIFSPTKRDINEQAVREAESTANFLKKYGGILRSPMNGSRTLGTNSAKNKKNTCGRSVDHNDVANKSPWIKSRENNVNHLEQSRTTISEAQNYTNATLKGKNWDNKEMNGDVKGLADKKKKRKRSFFQMLFDFSSSHSGKIFDTESNTNSKSESADEHSVGNVYGGNSDSPYINRLAVEHCNDRQNCDKSLDDSESSSAKKQKISQQKALNGQGNVAAEFQIANSFESFYDSSSKLMKKTWQKLQRSSSSGSGNERRGEDSEPSPLTFGDLVNPDGPNPVQSGVPIVSHSNCLWRRRRKSAFEGFDKSTVFADSKQSGNTSDYRSSRCIIEHESSIRLYPKLRKDGISSKSVSDSSQNTISRTSSTSFSKSSKSSEMIKSYDAINTNLKHSILKGLNSPATENNVTHETKVIRELTRKNNEKNLSEFVSKILFTEENDY